MLIVKLHLHYCKWIADIAQPLGSLQVPDYTGGINAEGYGQDRLLFWHQSSPDQSELINSFQVMNTEHLSQSAAEKLFTEIIQRINWSSTLEKIISVLQAICE